MFQQWPLLSISSTTLKSGPYWGGNMFNSRGSGCPGIRENSDLEAITNLPTQPFQKKRHSPNDASPAMGASRLQRGLKEIVPFKILCFKDMGR